jgi:hypothetical protein
MRDVRGADIFSQPDHIPDAQRTRQEDVSEGLLELRRDSLGEPAASGSAIPDHVESVDCALCTSESNVYSERFCCQERLRISLCAFPTYIAAREILITRNLQARQSLVMKFEALHGPDQAEKLKSLVSSMWSKRGGGNGEIFED